MKTPDLCPQPRYPRTFQLEGSLYEARQILCQGEKGSRWRADQVLLGEMMEEIQELDADPGKKLFGGFIAFVY